jgi:hypothetical protein
MLQVQEVDISQRCPEEAKENETPQVEATLRAGSGPLSTTQQCYLHNHVMLGKTGDRKCSIMLCYEMQGPA